MTIVHIVALAWTGAEMRPTMENDKLVRLSDVTAQRGGTQCG